MKHVFGDRRWLAAFASGAMALVLAATVLAANPIYVTPNGTDPAGASWATPTSLTNALAICTAADEIWLAEGTYSNGATFTVGANRMLYGGFTNGMTTRAERDWNVHRTFLDGRGQNLRVVTVSGTNVMLDGLIITNSAGSAAGGIIKSGTGTLTLANCRLVAHASSSSANHGVGGNFTAGSVLMTNCLVANNTENTYYVYGFGIYSFGADLDLVDCVVSNNSSPSFRGSPGLGLYFDKGTLRAWRTDFINNTGPANGAGPGSKQGGAGVYLGNTAGTSATFSNCVFRGNESKWCGSGMPGYGGAMFVNLAAAATARVVNCTFTGNTNSYGYGAAIALSGGTLILKNSILWSNVVSSGYTGSEIYKDGGTLDISYCDLTGLGFPHVTGATIPLNCRARDPLFASATDLHLRSPAGRWDPGVGGFVTTDGTCSPCIDGGDPADGIREEPTDNGNSRINMGRYGGTAQASKSPSAVAPLLENLGHNVYYHRAEITGELTNETFVSAHVYLCYGTNSVVGDMTNGWNIVTYMGEKQNSAEFSIWTPALLPATTYFYRWYAVNDEGSNWTAAASFNTGAVPPGGGTNVIHVSRLATGAGDGSDWAHAYPSFVKALLAIGGTRTNVWITGETYNEGMVAVVSGNATLFGGFTGTETTVSERALTNAFGVMTNYTVINGEASHQCLSITAGNVSMESLVLTNSATSFSGGGISKAGSGTLTMINCRLVGHAGTANGLGAYFSGGAVLMTNCVVASNTESGYYVNGYGIYSYNANLELVDCVISNNSSPSYRGTKGLGLYFDNGKLRVLRTDFIDNTGPATSAGPSGPPTDGGAGVCVGNSANTSAAFSNCVFRGNVAKFCGSGTPGIGGGMWLNLAAAATVRVVNCTFKDNANLFGNGGAIALSGGTLILKNSIFWTNSVAGGYTGSELFVTNAGSLVTNSYCCFAGTTAPYVVTGSSAVVQWGSGIKVGDPLYVGSSDVHLRSKGGHWDSSARAWVGDSVTSPCLDAGDPADPVGQELYPNGNVINMGAYGGTLQASMSWRSGTVVAIR